MSEAPLWRRARPPIWLKSPSSRWSNREQKCLGECEKEEKRATPRLPWESTSQISHRLPCLKVGASFLPLPHYLSLHQPASRAPLTTLISLVQINCQQKRLNPGPNITHKYRCSPMTLCLWWCSFQSNRCVFFFFSFGSFGVNLQHWIAVQCRAENSADFMIMRILIFNRNAGKSWPHGWTYYS